MFAKTATITKRRDLVLVRASSDVQDKAKQVGNVNRMLADQGLYVPESNWISITANRASVTTTPEFKALLASVERGEIGTVYVESLDRFGTDDETDLKSLLKLFRKHKTKLWDLTERQDWTDPEFTTRLMVLIGAEKSRGELDKISNRTQRGRITAIMERGAWAGGTAPFGYAKECFDSACKLLWRFEHTSNTKGDVYLPLPDGRWKPHQQNVPTPRKAQRTDYLKLAPSMFADRIELVRLLFRKYASASISPRQLTVWANKNGHRMYGQPLDDTRVKWLLRNHNYVGDYVYGVRDLSKYQRANAKGILERVTDDTERAGWHRKPEDRIIRPNAWEALVDRETFDRVQEKLNDPARKVTYPPRRSDWFLRGVLFCGHCGAQLGTSSGPQLGGRERDQIGGYLCNTYKRGYRSGYAKGCEHHGISHAWAEELILERLKQDGHTLAQAVGPELLQHATMLGEQLEQLDKEALQCVREGIKGYLAHLRRHPELAPAALRNVGQKIDVDKAGFDDLQWFAEHAEGLNVGAFNALEDFMSRVEREKVKAVRKELDDVTAKHAKMVENWALATPQMQAVLMGKIQELEARKGELEPLTIPLDERLRAIQARISERREELEKLLAGYGEMEQRERGEAIRRVLSKVVLYWEKLPYKRAQYRLLVDRTEFHYRDVSPSDSSYTRALGRPCTRTGTGSCSPPG